MDLQLPSRSNFGPNAKAYKSACESPKGIRSKMRVAEDKSRRRGETQKMRFGKKEKRTRWEVPKVRIAESWNRGQELLKFHYLILLFIILNPDPMRTLERSDRVSS